MPEFIQIGENFLVNRDDVVSLEIKPAPAHSQLTLRIGKPIFLLPEEVPSVRAALLTELTK